MAELSIEKTTIPGLLVLRLPVHSDARGWFKENWQREKMLALGLPDFEPVQNNISFNSQRGVTRGIHTEPWDKLVSVAAGRAFAAWVDMRAGASFGATFWLELDPSVSAFVPRGVGNSYQCLEDNTAYSYLVNDYWRAGVTYPALNLGDPAAAIPWPIPLSQAEISAKDLGSTELDQIDPIAPKKTLILGCHGQLGRALVDEFPDADAVDLAEFDLTDAVAVSQWPWPEYDVVLNAAAYTAVDAAETAEGRRMAWAANTVAPALLAQAAIEHRLTLVHYSTDYVFDGAESEHSEDEPLSPLGVYGQSKAAGDVAVALATRHYVVRTSWVIGDGKNFVRTMAELASRGVSPAVVDDQLGRLTFTAELARATRHLLDTRPAYGTYNVSNSGPITSWCEVARQVFELSGRLESEVMATTTTEYTMGKDTAPRPANSALSLAKIRATGFDPEAAEVALGRYLASEV